VGATAFALGASWRLVLPLSLLAPPLVHLAFAKLLRVPLPDGVLPAPW
jgi:putative tricarboxylic transport membrane protein